MTVPKKAPILKTAVLSLLALGSMTQAAPTIFWHNSGGDVLLQSNGSNLNSSFQLELGYFASSFAPTASNTSEWSTHWRPWDLLSTAGGFNPTFGFYSSSQSFTGSSTASVVSEYAQSFTIPTGSQAYLWVYNSKDYQPGTEWALVANTSSDSNPAQSWIFPNPALDASPTDPDWQLADVGTVVLGGVANVQGPGTFSSSPSVFALQTSAIPEPGPALLIFAVSMVAQMRRHRRIG